MDGLSKRALERRLRDTGVSKTAAVVAISRGWRFRWLAHLSPRAFTWVALRGGRRG
jgi:hypothetical protein